MKMVSAAKMKGDEARLKAAVPFNNWAMKFGPEPVLIDPAEVTYEKLPQKSLLVAFTSDKGLCFFSFFNAFLKSSTESYCLMVVWIRSLLNFRIILLYSLYAGLSVAYFLYSSILYSSLLLTAQCTCQSGSCTH